MATRLDQRIARLRLRKTDVERGGIKTRSTTLAKSEGKFDSAADAIDYISETMIPVDAEYTSNTFRQCERVENQIKEACDTKNVGIEFKHQGSVTADTHIKFYSDIDLLVLTKRFHDLKAPLTPTSPYTGDPMADLTQIRLIVEERLENSFPAAKVDKTGKKAVSISGGSLGRKIDVIAGAWLRTQQSEMSGKEEDRGVAILDLEGPRRITNFPFIHNKKLADMDYATKGKLKKLIRFVKSVRYDANDEIKFSSYDIAALCYRLPFDAFVRAGTSDFSLASEFLIFSERVRLDSTLLQSLWVPNDTRLIFGDSGASTDQLKLLNLEILEVLEQAKDSRKVLA